MKKVSIVIPTFNEEGNLQLLADTLLKEISTLPYLFEIIFVDDGSTDATLEILKTLNKSNSIFNYIKFARNYGHQNALKAGIDNSVGDCVISMDADLQHPPTLIADLLQHWEKGYIVVYTKRISTESVGYLKKQTSKLFYKIINILSNLELEEGTADFRLMDNKICDIIRNAKEVEIFFRAYIKAAGFKQIGINYVASKRFSGQTKYSFKKMLNLAFIAITSFSVKPLHFAAYLGLTFAFGSILFFPYIIYSLATGHAVSGWASLLVTIVFFGGVQLFVLGIIGIYIGKIFQQVKQQPHYSIEETSLHELNRFT